MDNSKSVIVEFNKTLDEFINKLITQFPQEGKLKSYYSAFKVSKMYDNVMPLKIFMGGCLNYAEQIKSRDSNFFVNKKEFVSKLQECTSFSNDIGLVNYWEDLSMNSKNAIWDYVQTLFVMGEMYINKDTSIINSINSVYSNLSVGEINKIEKNNEFSPEFISKLKL